MKLPLALYLAFRKDASEQVKKVVEAAAAVGRKVTTNRSATPAKPETAMRQPGRQDPDGTGRHGRSGARRRGHSRIDADSTRQRCRSRRRTALSAARRVTEIRVMIEKENGLVARLPAELDQAKVDEYIGQIGEPLRRRSMKRSSCWPRNGRIVTPEALKQIRAGARRNHQGDGRNRQRDEELRAIDRARPGQRPVRDQQPRLAVKLLDAIATKVDAVADDGADRI